MTRAERIEAELRRVETWVEFLLTTAKRCAKDRRFLSLAEAYDADVRNYEATLKSVRAALAPEEGTCQGWWNGAECRECGRVFAAINATGRDRCPGCGWTNAQQARFDQYGREPPPAPAERGEEDK